ncbi:MAG: hypothetical protein WD227_05105 [Vicinamibacterales bacterium]
MATELPRRAIGDGAQIAIVGASIVGALALLTSTVVSYWVATGATPAVLYGQLGNLATTLLKWRGVPVEWFGMLWFVVVAASALFSGFDQRARFNLTFLSSVSVAGLGLWLSSRRLMIAPAIPVIVATLAAFVVLVISARRTSPWKELPRHVAGDLMQLLRTPRARVAVAVSLACALVFGAFIQSRTATAGTAQDNSRAFRNWYLSGHKPAPQPLIATTGVRVVIFTEYTCTDCLPVLFSHERIVEDFRVSGGEAVELVIKDLPIDAECNPAAPRQTHTGACRAAVAVRVARATADAPTTRRLLLALNRARTGLTPATISQLMAERGLAGEFDRRYSDVLDSVRSDIATAHALGVYDPPTIFVNGTRLPRADPNFLRWALQAERERLTAVRSQSKR